MLFRSRQLLSTLEQLSQRIQQLEHQHTELIAGIEAGHALNRLTAQIAGAAHIALALGVAVECFAADMRRPLRRGRAGGLARARQASMLRERWSDGRYMAHDDWEEIERKAADVVYMRHATSGFARVASAQRRADGRFAKSLGCLT